MTDKCKYENLIYAVFVFGSFFSNRFPLGSISLRLSNTVNDVEHKLRVVIFAN